MQMEALMRFFVRTRQLLADLIPGICELGEWTRL